MRPPPRPSQKEGARTLVREKRYLLGDGVGMGKTRQVLMAYRRLWKRGLITQPMLVIVPHYQAAKHWVKEIAKWSSYSSMLIQGTRTQRRICYNGIEHRDPSTIYIINMDLARIDYDLLLSRKEFGVVVLDEAHKCKNYRQRTRGKHYEDGTREPGGRSTRNAICRIAEKAPYFWALTATPLLGRATELWSLLNMIGSKRPEDDFGSYWRWVEQWMPITLRYGQGQNYRHIGKVRRPLRKAFAEMLSHYMIRRKRSPEEFPTPIIETIVLPMLPEHRKVYDELKARMVLDCAGQPKKIAKNVLHHRLMLRLAALCPELNLENPVEITGSKFDWCEDLMGKGERCVFASNSKKALTLWSKRLTKKGISHGLYTGDDSVTKRDQVWQDFHAGKIEHLLCSADCSRESIDLTAGTVIVLLDRHWTPDMNVQMIGRVVRPPHTGGIMVYLLESENSIDQYVTSVNLEKDKVVGSLLPPTVIENYIYGEKNTVRKIQRNRQ